MAKQSENWVWNHSLTSGNDRLVLLYLADQGDDDGTNSFPSIARLAAKANVDKDTVRRALGRLESAGEILIERPERQGRGWFNRYTLVLGRPIEDVRELASKARDLRPFAGRDPRRRSTGRNSTESGQNGTQKVVEGGGRTAQLGVIPIDLLKEEELSLAEVNQQRFDTEFWPLYPRHEDKFGASRAWDKATRSTDADVILAGVIRYKDDPNRDPAYTKHPATWLNHECWNDDPLPQRAGRKVPRRNSGAEALLDEMGIAR